MVISNFGLMIQTAQPSDILIWVAVISAASAIASAVLVGFFNYYESKKLEQQRFENNDNLESKNREHAVILENLKIEQATRQRMQQAYSELMGHKYMILQVNASYFSELVRSGFLTNCSLISAISQVDCSHIAEIAKTDIKKAENEMNQTINDIDQDSTEFKISREADTRSRELLLKLGESYERLWATIGLIQVLFSGTPDLENLSD